MSRLALDHDDVKHGFMVGRAARLADWAFKKEQREFAVVIGRLRAKRWAEQNYERSLANRRRWARAHRDAETSRVKNWRHTRTKSKVFTCASPGCDVQWCRVPFGRMRGNIRPKYCSKQCFNRARYRRSLARLVRQKEAA